MRRGLLSAIVVGGLLLPAGPPFAAPEKPNVDADVAQFAGVRLEAVAAARAEQKKERGLVALDLAIGVMELGAATKQQQFEQSGEAQERLLGVLERLARAPPGSIAFAPEGPVDRVRSGILIAAAVPALQAQAQALSGQVAALAAARSEIAARKDEAAAARQALVKAREALVLLLGRRGELIGRLLHDDPKSAGASDLGTQASDLFDLIKRADAATDLRNKQLIVRLSAGAPAKKGLPPPTDPTRPKELRSFDAPRVTMVWPVAGDITHRFGEADKSGRPSQGLTMSVLPNGVVVAPFDGQVQYAGVFGAYGLILIIRHGADYHSLLAGLGRADVTSGQWLLAGEPVGALPETDEKNASATFYMELRRDGRPVDPQSRLVSRDVKPEDSKVRE